MKTRPKPPTNGPLQVRQAASVPAERPVLRFSPTAWAKLLFLRDYGDTEVGGFGIAPPDNLLLVEDIALVEQECSWAHVAFEDEAVADFFDRQVDAGRRPEQFARIWVHTHPDDCPQPSATDEETFARVFGQTEWAVMFIVAREGQTYARLRFNVGPGGEVEVPVAIDYQRPFAGSDSDAWMCEYQASVRRSTSRPHHVADIFGVGSPKRFGRQPNPLLEAWLADGEADALADFWPDGCGDVWDDDFAGDDQADCDHDTFSRRQQR